MAVLVRLSLDGSDLTVEAQSLESDPLFPDFVVLRGVRGVSDGAFPDVVVDTLSIDRGSVRYYCRGARSEPPIVSNPQT